MSTVIDLIPCPPVSEVVRDLPPSSLTWAPVFLFVSLSLTAKLEVIMRNLLIGTRQRQTRQSFLENSSHASREKYISSTCGKLGALTSQLILSTELMWEREESEKWAGC